MSSYRRHYLPGISRSDVKGGVRLIQPYSVTDYFLIFRVQNLLTSAGEKLVNGKTHGVGVGKEKQAGNPTSKALTKKINNQYLMHWLFI